MEKKNLYLDLRTIACFDDGKPSQKITGAAEAIHELRINNYSVTVFTTTDITTAEVESFLKDNGVEFDKVVSLPDFDILLSPNTVHFSKEWKWNLDSIVTFIPKAEKKPDLQKEMHDAMEQYKKWAKNAKKNCDICC